MKTRRTTRRSGFSLIEVMVAVVVMAIVTSQLLLSFSQQHTSSLEHERTIEIQEEVRLVANVILKDVRGGGFMVPNFAAVASRDGGNGASDLLCVSDPSVIDDTTLPAATAKFTGASIATAFAGSQSTVIVPSTSLDVDGDGDDDFAADSGVIIATGVEGHCGRITNVSKGATNATITFTPATLGTFGATTSDVVVPATVYEVNGGTTTLSRNNLVLSNHIEDMQVEFGVDQDRNGTVEGAEFPIDDLDGEEFELVRNVRVHVTAREARAEPDFNGQFPAVANRVAGAADNFKRRRITGDAILRNLR